MAQEYKWFPLILCPELVVCKAYLTQHRPGPNFAFTCLLHLACEEGFVKPLPNPPTQWLESAL